MQLNSKTTKYVVCYFYSAEDFEIFAQKNVHPEVFLILRRFFCFCRRNFRREQIQSCQ